MLLRCKWEIHSPSPLTSRFTTATSIALLFCNTTHNGVSRVKWGEVTGEWRKLHNTISKPPLRCHLSRNLTPEYLTLVGSHSNTLKRNLQPRHVVTVNIGHYGVSCPHKNRFQALDELPVLRSRTHDVRANLRICRLFNDKSSSDVHSVE